MRYFVLLAALLVPSVAKAQLWFESIMADLNACRVQAWQQCPETLACFQARTFAKAVCRATCERELRERETTITRHLRSEAFACITEAQEQGISCEDQSAWRLSEVTARLDAFDYALYEYPYLVRMTPAEIVDRIYRVAERGFTAQGGCTTSGHSVTLIYTTALAINRVRTTGDGAHRWEQAQALSLRWLRAKRGY